MAFACECFRHSIHEDVIALCLMHWKIGERQDQADVAQLCGASSPRRGSLLLTQSCSR